jgi:hypothetical protein
MMNQLQDQQVEQAYDLTIQQLQQYQNGPQNQYHQHPQQHHHHHGKGKKSSHSQGGGVSRRTSMIHLKHPQHHQQQTHRRNHPQNHGHRDESPNNEDSDDVRYNPEAVSETTVTYLNRNELSRAMDNSMAVAETEVETDDNVPSLQNMSIHNSTLNDDHEGMQSTMNGEAIMDGGGGGSGEDSRMGFSYGMVGAHDAESNDKMIQMLCDFEVL